tara:strand:- start:395 stop:502 length:108 start_codon:yes stop_codon:yes gene_type:complete
LEGDLDLLLVGDLDLGDLDLGDLDLDLVGDLDLLL